MLKKVATTGVDLDCVYSQTLQRIRDQKGSRSRLGMEVLMWVSHAERPLRIDELCHALAVEKGSTDIDPENITPQDTVLGSCLGLAVVDSETSTVRLTHYTLQEYLSQPGILPNAHTTLGQICLTYLNYDQIRGLPAENDSSLSGMRFLEYASLHWGRHAKMELSNDTKSLALKLLSRYDDHISSVLLSNHVHSGLPPPLSHRPFPGLHCASYFGVGEVIAALIEMEGCDINQRDWQRFTPLMRAAQQGNQGAVTLLLARDDIDPDGSRHDGQTPLMWASYNGHERVVRLLLARGGVNPEKVDRNGRTPLMWAACKGREGVVRLLLARDNLNPDKPSNDGRTPLAWASFKGHEGVVRQLLARSGVNPDRLDRYGTTPLWGASSNGHEGVVRLLLARADVNPDRQDNDGETPLWWASFNGHEGVVGLLLARDDVNPNKPNPSGGTPLWWASRNGHEGVVRLLLARHDVNPASRIAAVKYYCKPPLGAGK